MDISYSINHDIPDKSYSPIVPIIRNPSPRPVASSIPLGDRRIIPLSVTSTTVTPTRVTTTSATPNRVILTSVTPTTATPGVTPSDLASIDLASVGLTTTTIASNNVSPSGVAPTTVAPSGIAIKTPDNKVSTNSSINHATEISKLQRGPALRTPGQRVPPHHKPPRRPLAYSSPSRILGNLFYKPVQHSGLYRNPFHGLLRRTNPAVGLPYGLKYQTIYPNGSPLFRKNRRVGLFRH